MPRETPESMHQLLMGAALAALQEKQAGELPAMVPNFGDLAYHLKNALVKHAHQLPPCVIEELAALHTMTFLFGVEAGHIEVQIHPITPEQAALLKTQPKHHA